MGRIWLLMLQEAEYYETEENTGRLCLGDFGADAFHCECNSRKRR